MNTEFEVLVEQNLILLKKYSELKEENEKLKENLRTSCRYYAPGGECALTAHNCPGTAKCIEKSKQKLEKIKEYIENMLKCSTGHTQTYYDILTIIEE